MNGFCSIIPDPLAPTEGQLQGPIPSTSAAATKPHDMLPEYELEEDEISGKNDPEMPGLITNFAGDNEVYEQNFGNWLSNG